MAYSTSGKIQASDINGFLQNNPNNINQVWGSGSGDSGYGQSDIPPVTISSKVGYSTWLALINNITAAANHQGTAIITPMARQEAIPAAPTASSQVKAILLSNITTNLALINTGRLNASSQGDTPPPTTKTLSSTWQNNTSLSLNVQFANHNAARYFFNCGGQLGITAGHPSTTGNNINRLISEICTNMGTILLSSPSGTTTAKLSGANYTGVYKAGGAVSGGSTTNTGYGFYSWTGTPTTVHTQQGTYGYRGHLAPYFYANSATARVQVSYNGSGRVTVTVLFSGLTNITVATGTSITVTVRPPNPNLSPSWGTISIS